MVEADIIWGSSGSGNSGGGGFDVRTYDKDGNTLDLISVGEGQGVDIAADGSLSANNLQTPGDAGGAAYQSYFGNVADYAANADVSLGGGGDCGDCGVKNDGNQNNSSYFKKALAVSAVLIANDVTGVGVADDIAIPFILIGGLILDETIGSGNENYPGPWYETQPDPRSRAIASRGLPSFNVVTVLTFLVSISISSLCFSDIKK